MNWFEVFQLSLLPKRYCMIPLETLFNSVSTCYHFICSSLVSLLFSITKFYYNLTCFRYASLLVRLSTYSIFNNEVTDGTSRGAANLRVRDVLHFFFLLIFNQSKLRDLFKGEQLEAILRSKDPKNITVVCK